MKAKKPDSAIAYEAIASTGASPNGNPKQGNSIVVSLQVSNPRPKAGNIVELKTGYRGDALELAREYSVLMIVDAIFQKWDRYCGGNVGIAKDAQGNAHFYTIDNRGADVSKITGWVERNLGWFSRYDRKTIEKLKVLRKFPQPPEKGLIGYQDAGRFVYDMGLNSEMESTE